MISAHRLRFAYPGGREVLRGIDLDVPKGTTLVLAGANGSGKSTLLGCLGGLLAPSAGEVVVCGHRSPGREAAIRRVTGLVLQDADLQVLGATVGEDLLLGASTEVNGDGSLARELAGRFGLGDEWESPVHALSWGQKRKLCILGILLRRPRVLLLDEPFSGLDYRSAVEMRALILEQKRSGLTQVIAAHDLDPLADLADRWAVLEKGELVLSGEESDVFHRLLEFGVRPPGHWSPGSGREAGS